MLSYMKVYARMIFMQMALSRFELVTFKFLWTKKNLNAIRCKSSTWVHHFMVREG
jgi:hypothetical protein